ncbi:MAG: hypothetical protein AB1758_06670 [Candidatus Eremiobacterota bacterium]
MDSADEVQGLPASDIIEFEVREQSRHPIHHRTTPLPLRVKSGTMGDQLLTLETANGPLEVPWGDVELVALGMIEEIPMDVQAPKGALRQMFGKITGKASENEERKLRQVREIYLLDLYTSSFEQPFRIDSATVNYKSFLGHDMSYVSFQNFFRLVTRLARGCTSARFDESVTAFLNRRRDAVKRYPAVYDFELELQQIRSRMDELTEHGALNLQRETWADEWDDVG